MSADDASPPRDLAQRKRAVVDRVEEGWAVLLVGEREVEHHLPVADLPQDAREGSWLTVAETTEGLRVICVDDAGAEARRDAVRARQERLRERGGRFSP